MSTLRFTNEELQRFLDELKPAVLADNPVNGTVLKDYLERHKMSSTVENLHKAAKALVNALDWAVPPQPKKSPSEKPFIEQQKSAIKEEASFVEKVRAGEKADAYAKQQAAGRARIKTLLESFLPINKRGAVDHAMKERVVGSLNQQVAKYEKQGADMTKVADAVSDEIQRVYQTIEKSRERI